LCHYHAVFCYYGSVLNLKSDIVIPLALIFLLRIALAIWGLLCFHMNFRIDFSIFLASVFGVTFSHFIFPNGIQWYRILGLFTFLLPKQGMLPQKSQKSTIWLSVICCFIKILTNFPITFRRVDVS
jgi:hypothetical protein